VFFDVGGTLLRLTQEPSALFSRILAENGIHVAPADLYRTMREVEVDSPGILEPGANSEGAYWRAYDEQILGRLGLRPTTQVLEEVARRFAKEVELVPFPETKATLAAVRARGYPMGVISNASHGILGDLERTGISGFFEHVVYSQLVRAAKPDRRIFEEALRRFGVSAAMAWHVGDNPLADIQGAAAVGMRPIFVDRGGHEPPAGAQVVADLRGVVDLLQRAEA
jgi:putative hydrolase of the HAD superfamily